MTRLMIDAHVILAEAKQRLDDSKTIDGYDKLIILGLCTVLAAFVAEEEARWGKAS